MTSSALRNPVRKRATRAYFLQARGRNYYCIVVFGAPISPTRAHDSGSLACNCPPFLGLEPPVGFACRQLHAHHTPCGRPSETIQNSLCRAQSPLSVPPSENGERERDRNS